VHLYISVTLRSFATLFPVAVAKWDLDSFP